MLSDPFQAVDTRDAHLDLVVRKVIDCATDAVTNLTLRE
jgi:hypothetical protein